MASELLRAGDAIGHIVASLPRAPRDVDMAVVARTMLHVWDWHTERHNRRYNEVRPLCSIAEPQRVDVFWRQGRHASPPSLSLCSFRHPVAHGIVEQTSVTSQVVCV